MPLRHEKVLPPSTIRQGREPAGAEPGDKPMWTAGPGLERGGGNHDLREQRGSHLSLLISVGGLALPVSTIAVLMGLTLGELPVAFESIHYWIAIAIVALLAISSDG